jgi:hypothetical protein
MSLAASFIDLATYDELEKYFYSADSDAVTYFVRQTRKSSWFTQIPTKFSTIGQGDFGLNGWTVTIARGGDYLLNAWLRVTTPAVTASGTTQYSWVKNLMHNLVDYVEIKFNDLTVQRIDHYVFDFLSEIMIPSDQKRSYREMTGYGNTVLDRNGKSQFIAGLNAGVAHELNLPLPFFFSRDTGVALPCAALPYNEMKLVFNFRPITDLLVKNTILNPTRITSTAEVAPSAGFIGSASGTAGVSGGLQSQVMATTSDTNVANAKLSNVEVWGTYAMVSNVERAMMAKTARNIIIEQYFTTSPTSIVNDGSFSTDIRFAHAIKALFVAARSTDASFQLSSASGFNATASSPHELPTLILASGNLDKANQPGWDVSDRGINGHIVHNSIANGGGYGGARWSNYSKIDVATEWSTGHVSRTNPIKDLTLTYENTKRLDAMRPEYFQNIVPYYTAVSAPEEDGINLYSYALDMSAVDPMGSTNFGKLTTVSITANMVANYKKGTTTNSDVQMLIACVNHNVVRISGGALGFPIL